MIAVLAFPSAGWWIAAVTQSYRGWPVVATDL
jgi:hypothetical protein